MLTVAGDQRSVGILRVDGHRVTLEPLPPNIGLHALPLVAGATGG